MIAMRKFLFRIDVRHFTYCAFKLLMNGKCLSKSDDGTCVCVCGLVDALILLILELTAVSLRRKRNNIM